MKNTKITPKQKTKDLFRLHEVLPDLAAIKIKKTTTGVSICEIDFNKHPPLNFTLAAVNSSTSQAYINALNMIWDEGRGFTHLDLNPVVFTHAAIGRLTVETQEQIRLIK
jgi:hypothetical protein